MNKNIKKQLEQLRSVKVDFNDNTTTILIPKTQEVIPEALNKGEVYLVELSENLLNPAVNSTLAANWNAGKVPNHKYYKVEYLDKVGSMYKFTGIAVENGEDIYTEDWYGYFPENQFKVVERY